MIKRGIKPRPQQVLLAEAIVKNSQSPNPLTGNQLLLSVNYKGAYAKQIARVIESKGVQKALSDMGFSEEGADSVVKELLYDKRVKPTDRLNAVDKVYKRLGSYKPEKAIIITAQVSEEVKERLDKLLSQAS